MKRFLLIFIAVLNGLLLFSQDVIIRKNGDQINCLVTKVDSITVYFTINRNGNSTQTSILKSEVSDIRYNVVDTKTSSKSSAKDSSRIGSFLPPLSIGFGTGLNSFTGMLGIIIQGKVSKKLLVQGGIGIGSWGYKYSAGINYFKRDNGGWSFGLGYSYCSGAEDVNANLEVYSGSTTITKNVRLNFLPTGTVNLKASYNWLIKKKNILYIDLGYAIPTTNNPWEVLDGSKLTPTSESVMQMTQPGGLMFGLGFTFGI